MVLVRSSPSGRNVDVGGGGDLPDGDYPGEPLSWDGAAWLGSPILALDLIIPRDAAAGLSLDAGAAQITLNGGGSSLQLNLSEGAILYAPTGHRVRISVDTGDRFLADDIGLAFFGSPPVAQPSITGVTAQEQIDSIVAAGALLGLWTDDR